MRTPFDIAALLQAHGYLEGGAGAGALMKEAGFAWITSDLAEIVAATHQSGGVCLIAHPGRGDGFTDFDPDMLDDLRARVPIDGLEVYYPLHTPEKTAAYLEYVRRHGLLQSSGSDSHSRSGQLPIKYRAEQSRSLLERLGVRLR